jgi:branched-chain amino acid transport system substrate-binding protein
MSFRSRLNARFGVALVAGVGLALLAVGFSGCSGGGGDPNKIVIVSSLPRTGSAQGQTNSMVNGIKMAFDEVGHKVGNFTIEYFDWDDATAAAGEWTAEAETGNAQKAIANADVMVYIGPYNSGAAKISMPILNEPGMLMISPACTWPGLTKPGYGAGEPESYRPTGKINFTRVVPTDDVQALVGATFAKDELKAKTVYILDDTQVYGKGIADLFEKVCKDVGLEVLGHDSINEKQQEFTGLMTRIRGLNGGKGPDVLYFGGTTQTKGGQIAKDMVNVGLKCPLIAPDGCYEQAFIDSAGPETVNGRCYVTFGGLDPTKLTGAGKQFVDGYKKKFDKMPEAYAVYGYEAAKVALEAIKRAGKKDRNAIREAALTIKDFDQGAVGKWSFDENGDTTQAQFTVSKVEGGEFKPVKEITGEDLRKRK